MASGVLVLPFLIREVAVVDAGRAGLAAGFSFSGALGRDNFGAGRSSVAFALPFDVLGWVFNAIRVFVAFDLHVEDLLGDGHSLWLSERDFQAFPELSNSRRLIPR